MHALRQALDLAQGLSTSRTGGRLHLRPRLDVADRDTGSKVIAPTSSEMIFIASPSCLRPLRSVEPAGQSDLSQASSEASTVIFCPVYSDRSPGGGVATGGPTAP